MSGRRESLRRDIVFIGGLVLVAAALVLYLTTGSGNDAASAAPASQPEASASATAGGGEQTGARGMERRVPGDPLALGDPDAPVGVVVFSDYRCPFCAKFSRDTEPELIRRYVEAGKLRIEWRDFPIFGEQSMLAARAGRAAADQGRFWEFNRAVYAAAPERTKANLTEQALIGFAEQAEVPDIEKFTAGMRGSSYDAVINADLAQGTGIGVPSTPAFLIDDVPLLGAQPTEEFVRAIDAALAGR
ncbi:disulfide bond formation protein [Mycobacterium sp. E802]|uniref:DsbA family protein n=1 Tax=Mycobacterium sp. E802 TaxID=1834152 RepID=UPI00080214E6|nr:thioredoxin domain-containing protein [Mycobacterium sp. E802]OBG83453.1 disulfide bond formation protein [Mycobacterium sp. E802]